MEMNHIKENAKATERLAGLVKSLTDDELKLVIYKEGWTVAVALGHIAFWDERRRLVIKAWKKKGVKPIVHIDDIVNDILIPFLLATPVRKAAALAVATARALDEEIAALSPRMVKAIEALNDEVALNRADTRNSHID